VKTFLFIVGIIVAIGLIIVGILFARKNPKDVKKVGEIADKVEDKVGEVYKEATKKTE